MLSIAAPSTAMADCSSIRSTVSPSPSMREVEKKSGAQGWVYMAFNCVGCHFNGGGGMGPPLMDDQWIYGGSVENIAASILQGRPNGMPSFRAIVAGNQVWQLAAYVKSLSAEADAADQEGSPEPSKFERSPD